MRKFLLEYSTYSNGKTECNGWWEIVGDKLVNPCGGYHSYVPSPDDIIAEAEDFEDLDHSYLIQPDSDFGWISPEGQFYGCDYFKHSEVAQYIFGATEGDLEEKGWVKVFKNFHNRHRDWYCFKYLTDYQKATLENLGLEMEE